MSQAKVVLDVMDGGSTTIGLNSTQVSGDISALQSLTALTYISLYNTCVLFK